jgi:hypothetical protein
MAVAVYKPYNWASTNSVRRLDMLQLTMSACALPYGTSCGSASHVVQSSFALLCVQFT